MTRRHENVGRQDKPQQRRSRDPSLAYRRDNGFPILSCLSFITLETHHASFYRVPFAVYAHCHRVWVPAERAAIVPSPERPRTMAPIAVGHASALASLGIPFREALR